MVAEANDLHAAAMAAVLRKHHGIDPIRLDLQDFPRHVGSFRMGRMAVSSSVADIELDAVRSVWWRRPRPCGVPVSTNASDDSYRQAECDSFIQGLLMSLPVRWVNDPRAERMANRKIVQLRAAQQLGLAVPETLVTNDPGQALEFIESRPQDVIYKRVGTTRDFSPTRIVTKRDIARLNSIKSSPTIFQDYIEAKADLRIAWIGGHECAVRIDSQSGIGRVDSRLDSSVEFTPCELPRSVSDALGALMTSLGLVFGVIDIRLGTDGQYYFLEVNPQGQFAYMEIKTGVSIFERLADLLVTGEATVAHRSSESQHLELRPVGCSGS
jgi:hypothetical protein